MFSIEGCNYLKNEAFSWKIGGFSVANEINEMNRKTWIQRFNIYFWFYLSKRRKNCLLTEFSKRNGIQKWKNTRKLVNNNSIQRKTFWWKMFPMRHKKSLESPFDISDTDAMIQRTQLNDNDFWFQSNIIFGDKNRELYYKPLGPLILLKFIHNVAYKITNTVFLWKYGLYD